MHKFITLIILSIITIKMSYPNPIDEAFVASAKVNGVIVYNSCVLIPPATPQQQTWCTGVYAKYINSLQIVNSPLPLLFSTTPSAYSWSPFDICRYETSHFVFDNPAVLPYCPSV